MKSKLLLVILSLGLLGNANRSQAGISDFIWENRGIIAAVAVVAVALYAYRTPPRTPDDRDQAGIRDNTAKLIDMVNASRPVSPSRFAEGKLSHSPRSSNGPVAKSLSIPLKITEGPAESLSDSDETTAP